MLDLWLVEWTLGATRDCGVRDGWRMRVAKNKEKCVAQRARHRRIDRRKGRMR